VDAFADAATVHVTGVSKGKGFAGVMKRHNFKGGPGGHGSHAHREPGSIGQCATPSRVFRGKRLPGHMGTETVTVRNLEVVKVDPEQNLLIVKGAVPGGKGALLTIRMA
jgi:large subunit ribosomal protein L3